VSITQSWLKRFAMNAGPAVGATAVLAMSAGPALAQELPGPSDASPEQEFTDAAAVVDQYWNTHFAEYFGGSYTPPELLPGSSVGVPGLYDSSVEQLTCGQKALSPKNAWYCGAGDFIVADYNFLNNQDVGDSFIWLVVAHEWGHAVQARLDLPYQAVQDELQADCLAGAALAGATADALIQWDAGDDQELFNTLDAIADETPWTNPDSHGDTSERVYWYTYGVKNGPNGCLPQQ
jgi:predicted metalloprotease